MSFTKKLKKSYLLLFLTLIAILSSFFVAQEVTQVRAAAAPKHYLYVFPDGHMYVYDADNNYSLVKHVPLPTTGNIRGVVSSSATGMLYVSYGGNGGSH